ncbi:MAG: enoyl-CoA hydratase-related protein [Gordonia sp. (in: high G+C Gram-positive bacteria)]|uniref:enoyl-CoA hydratase/isomerase family protein n=1 Tax=Gordonia sp. (in: high G+C Gram-positive bacteria) TaxID=84139 RepID=UPI003C766E02
MTDALVHTVGEDGVITLTITRPQAKNSLNRDVLDALDAALVRYRNDHSVRALILTGADGVFCAGADITDFDKLRAAPLIGDRADAGGDLWRSLGAFPKPVLAAVEGLALGGGCELMLACDIVVAGRSARIGVPEVRLGVIPGGGGTQRLIRAVGRARAMTMLLTGDPVTAPEAADMGLISTVVDDGAALAEAERLAARVAANSPLAVALAKDAALQTFETSLHQGLEHEKRNFVVALQSDDCREGEDAFRNRRRPTFTGR